MKKLISFILIFTLFASCSSAENTTRTRAMNDPSLPGEMQDYIYQAIVKDLNSDEFFVENVSTVYISEEYLEELAFNSESNIFFGYNLDVLQQQFEGKKYVFTLGENNQTIVKEWEPYQNPMETVIRNVAIGTGIILICVTVSAVTGGTVSAIFAAAAKKAAHDAIFGSLGGTVVGYVSEYVKNGDPEKALEAAAIKGSEAFKWGAICGTVRGATGKELRLLGLIPNGLSTSQAAEIQNESGYPLSVIKEFKSVDEYNVYKEAGLYAETVGNRTALIRPINWNQIDESGKTNLERIALGENPLDPNGKAYEIRHVGQKSDPVWAILTQSDLRGENGFSNLHDNLINSDKNGSLPDSKQAAQFWKDLAITLQGT